MKFIGHINGDSTTWEKNWPFNQSTIKQKCLNSECIQGIHCSMAPSSVII